MTNQSGRHSSVGFRRRTARWNFAGKKSLCACSIATLCKSRRTAKRSTLKATTTSRSNNSQDVREKLTTTLQPTLSPSQGEREKVRGFSVKVGMISLGCAKNLVDAEIMLGSV